MMRPPMGLQIPMPRPGSMDPSCRFPQQGAGILPGGPGMIGRPPMQGVYGPRAPMIINRMPGAPPQQPVIVMQPGQRPGTGGPPLVTILHKAYVLKYSFKINDFLLGSFGSWSTSCGSVLP